jgi:Mn-dependent DtxR family transcriptional regulator
MANWTFITNHGAVLTCVAKRGKIKALDVALETGLTERSVRRMIADLAAEGYIEKKREGGINRYEINTNLPLRRPESRDIRVQELLTIFAPQVGTEHKSDS